MKWVLLLVYIFLGCKPQKTIEVVELPKKTQFDSHRRIIPTDGPENARKMKYYNSLQHKNYYKLKKSQ